MTIMKYMISYRIYHAYTQNDNQTTPYIYHRLMHIYTTLNKDYSHQYTVVDAYVDIRISQHLC